MKNKIVVMYRLKNEERWIAKSIQSILDICSEIVILDDGSTDSSPDILERYSDKINIISQKNQGLASALNLGISKMKGDWFKWFSPDDVMYSNTIETLIDEAKNHSDNIILYSNWNIIDDTGNTLREFHESNYNELSEFDFNLRLLDGQQINVNTTLIPAIFLKKYGIRKLDEPVAIDYDFFLRSALLHDVRFHLISQPLVKYRIHSDQLSHKNISKTLNYISEIKDEILMKLDESLRNKYNHGLEQYKKTKPTKTKTLEFGMKLLSSAPTWASDRVLMLYLNKIRHNR